MARWNLIGIDFEYNSTKSEKLNVVCVSMKPAEGHAKSFWLNKRNYQGVSDFGEYLSELDDPILLCYSGTAEGGAFYSLGYNLYDFNVIDVMAEYRMLVNHHPKWSFGYHLQDKNLVLFKKEGGGSKSGGDSKVPYGYASACLKVLGEKIDTQQKKDVRDLIIKGSLLESNKSRIMAYCESDVEFLVPLFKAIAEEHCKKAKIPKEQYIKEALRRGRRSFATTSYIERKGYSIDLEAFQNFSPRIPEIQDMAMELAARNTMASSNLPAYTFDIKNRRWKKNAKGIQAWIASSKYGDVWPKTGKRRAYELTEEVLAKFCTERHSYSDGVVPQLLNTARIISSVNSMSPTPRTKDSSVMKDYIGPDGRVRPHLNPFGSQSHRWQPKATSYLLLKTAWMRTLFHPPKDKVVVAIDYSQQEFLLCALLSGDKKMMEAYLSGDTYLYSGKLSGEIPWGATKKTHAIERARWKAIVLGLSYGKTEWGLSFDLEDNFLPNPDDREVGGGKRFRTEKAKRNFLVGKAEKYVERYKSLYPTYFNWVEEQVDRYYEREYQKLTNGWTMYGSNMNRRSVGNFFPQGEGAVILDNALVLIQKYGLQNYSDPLTVGPLHDAAYSEVNADTWQKDTVELAKCMTEGFWQWAESLGYRRGEVPELRVDVEAWGDTFDHLKTAPDAHNVCLDIYEKEVTIDTVTYAVDWKPPKETPEGLMEVKVANKHADERLKKEDLIRWSSYFRKSPTTDTHESF